MKIILYNNYECVILFVNKIFSVYKTGDYYRVYNEIIKKMKVSYKDSIMIK